MKQNGINLTEEEQKQLNSMSFSKDTRINPKVINPKLSDVERKYPKQSEKYIVGS